MHHAKTSNQLPVTEREEGIQRKPHPQGEWLFQLWALNPFSSRLDTTKLHKTHW